MILSVYMAIAVKLTVLITIAMGTFLVPLLGMTSLVDAAPLMIPFVLFAVVVVVFRFVLPSQLKRYQAGLFRNRQLVKLTTLIVLALALGVLWRVMLTQIVAIAMQPFIYLLFAMLLDFVWVELLMTVLILFAQCLVSVWWLLRYPYGRYQVVLKRTL